MSLVTFLINCGAPMNIIFFWQSEDYKLLIWSYRSCVCVRERNIMLTLCLEWVIDFEQVEHSIDILNQIKIMYWIRTSTLILNWGVCSPWGVEWHLLLIYVLCTYGLITSILMLFGWLKDCNPLACMNQSYLGGHIVVSTSSLQAYHRWLEHLFEQWNLLKSSDIHITISIGSRISVTGTLSYVTGKTANLPQCRFVYFFPRCMMTAEDSYVGGVLCS
jgi:hypothetical protein